MANSSNLPPLVLCSKFVLVDAKGTPRCAIALHDDGTVFLHLMDASGAVASGIEVNAIGDVSAPRAGGQRLVSRPMPADSDDEDVDLTGFVERMNGAADDDIVLEDDDIDPPGVG